METEKLGFLLSFMTTLVVLIIVAMNKQATLNVFEFVNNFGERIENLGIPLSLFILVTLVGSLLLIGIVYYGFLAFEQRGLPSNRTLSKISKQVGEEPFQLKKVSGKWVAITKDDK